jgi:hypothetical protein
MSGARPRWHVHFTPTASSSFNQVERFFADVTEKQIRRGVHCSTKNWKLQSALISTPSTRPKALPMDQSADDILAAVKRFCLNTLEIASAQAEIAPTSESGHEVPLRQQVTWTEINRSTAAMPKPQVRGSGWFVGQFVPAELGLRRQTDVELKWGSTGRRQTI